METKDTVVIRCLTELVDHNKEMLAWAGEEEHRSDMVHYYEGKCDAYSRVLEMLQDIERMTS